MVNKTQPQQEQQTEEGYSIASEEISESLLLRCWNKAVEQVNEAVRINKESGVRYPDMYVAYYDEMGPMDMLKKKRWLASTINPKKLGRISMSNQETSINVIAKRSPFSPEGDCLGQNG
jgi:hypothetical protein